MKTTLSKSDIDGQRIRQILQTPFENIDGVTVCQLFVELDNGILFQLVSEDELEDTGLLQTISRKHLIPVQFPKGTPDGVGETIRTLVVSQLLPTIGVQISNNHILSFLSSGPNYVGPFISEIEPHFTGEIFSYWNGEPIR